MIRFDSFARSACREIQVVAELAVAVGCCGTCRNFSLKESVAAYPVRRNPTVCEILAVLHFSASMAFGKKRKTQEICGEAFTLDCR